MKTEARGMVEDGEKLLDVREVAQLLNVPISWVYAAAERGELPSFRIGKYRRLSRAEVLAWLQARHSNNGKGGR